jgi:hypothetical protein
LFVEGLPEPNLTTATTTDLTGYLYGDGSNISSMGTIDGWIPANETWTYASADDPTYTFTVGADVTTKYSVGMKIKLTQGTVKYFIITAISAYSGGNTTITVYGGTDYNLEDAAISANYYSLVKSPQGFPMSPAKWTELKTDTSSRTQSSASSDTWYNIGTTNCQLSIPIGVWNVSFKVSMVGVSTSSTTMTIRACLSTANNSSTNQNLQAQSYSYSETYMADTFVGSDIIPITSKTTYYLNGLCISSTLNFVNFDNNTTQMFIRATCAYL